MAAPDLRSRWDRLTRDTTFRVATLYAGASWFVVEAADTLGGSTAVVRGVALALGAGFLVVVPLVWLWGRREEGAATGGAGESSRADVVPGAAVSGGRRGEGRARGTRRWAAALLLLIALAGVAWWAGTGRSAGPVPVEATRLAVVPFHVSGSESVRELGVGMVDLLSAGMNDVAGIRTVSGRTVLARLDGETGYAPVPLERALDVGRAVGAGSVLTGSVTAVGGQVRLAGQVRAVEGGEVLASAEVQGEEADVLALVDALAVRLLAGMWQSTDPLPSVRTAALTTTSPRALRAYLRGERLLRSMRMAEATESFHEAVEADSTFSLAWLRLAESTGWRSAATEDLAERQRHMERALRYADRLPTREASLVRAAALEESGRLASLDSLEAFVVRYPDDPYGWYLLGDARYHAARLGLDDPAEIIRPFLMAVRLDPLFAMGLTHAVDLALTRGDREEYERLMRQYERTATPERVERLRSQAAIRWAPADRVVPEFLAQVRAVAETGDMTWLNGLVGALGTRTRLDPETDPLDYAVALDSSRAILAGHPAWEDRSRQLIAVNHLALGRSEEGLRLLDHWLARDPAWGPPVPQRFRRPLIRVMWSITVGTGPGAVDEDLAVLEPAADEVPVIASVLRYHYLTRGQPKRADRFPARANAPPDVDSVGVELGFRGWEQLLRGDTLGGIESVGEAIDRLGFLDVGTIDPALFPYAVALSRRPLTRDRGIRMLRWSTEHRAVEPGPAFLALARAHEDAGEHEEARRAYAHVIRLWEGADPYRQPDVDEARRALVRLSAEGATR